jgi:surface antigen
MSLGRTAPPRHTASLRRAGRIGHTRPGRLIAAITLAILAPAAVVVPAVAATSSTSAGVPTVVLCGGYRGCDRAGYNSYGYSQHSRTSYWRMYAGDECTNYVAYVEATHFGVAAPRYLLGNAYQWPASARAHGVRVNKTPSVGSVAVWPGGAYGIGPDGHVAVVEKVGPHHSYIVVSQQHLLAVANGYEWTRINAGFSSRVWEPWPSFFIHFRLRRHIPGGPIAGLRRHRAQRHGHARKRRRSRRRQRSRQRHRAHHQRR